MMDGGFNTYPERIDAKKVRERSPSFMDHYSQATLFFNSQSEPEKQHIIDALRFELGKVETVAIRERMLTILLQIDTGLAAQVAYGLGLHIPKTPEIINLSFPADADPASYQSVKKESSLKISAALSMTGTIKDSIATRKIAILTADGVDALSISKVRDALLKQGAVVKIIAPRLGNIHAKDQTIIPVDESLLTAASVVYDAVYVAGGSNAVATLESEADAIHFLNEAFKHCKPVAAAMDAMPVLEATYFYKKLPESNDPDTAIQEGIIIDDQYARLADTFIASIMKHRFWHREKPRKIPA